MKKYVLFFLLALFLFLNISYAETIAPIDVTSMDIYDLEDALDKGYITSEQLVNIYLERIEKYDVLFNSINQINPNALEQAKQLDKERAEGNIRGRLHGIPIVVKCNIDVVGIPTTAGTKTLSKNYPKENAYAVQQLVDEGAIVLGSTNMSELAFSAASSYSSYGHVKNVFNTDYTPFGSSGGSAVAVKAGFAAAALGTDTNSSIRLPAMAAGLVGARPTLGLVSRTGVIPYDIERDTVGVITNSVRDNSLLLGIISGTDSKDSYTQNASDHIIDIDYSKNNLKGVKIGVPTQYVKGKNTESGVTGLTDDEIYQMMDDSISKLEEDGAEIIYLNNFVRSSNVSVSSQTYAGITMCDNFNEYIKGTTGNIRSFRQLAESSGHVQDLSGYVQGCGGHYQSKASRDTLKNKYRDYVDKYFEENDLDVILYPTVKNRIFELGQRGVVSPGSSLGSVIGYPSITVPMGKASDGFTYGIEFFSLGYNEEMLYRVAYGFEKVNYNRIEVSPLAPSTYEIPSKVLELNELYEKAVANKSSLNKSWIKHVKKFYANYNDEDIEERAQELIDEYPIEKAKSNFLSILLKVVLGIVILFVIYVIYRIIRRKIRRYIRKKRLAMKKKTTTKKSSNKRKTKKKKKRKKRRG